MLLQAVIVILTIPFVNSLFVIAMHRMMVLPLMKLIVSLLTLGWVSKALQAMIFVLFLLFLAVPFKGHRDSGFLLVCTP